MNKLVRSKQIEFLRCFRDRLLHGDLVTKLLFKKQQQQSSRKLVCQNMTTVEANLNVACAPVCAWSVILKTIKHIIRTRHQMRATRTDRTCWSSPRCVACCSTTAATRRRPTVRIPPSSVPPALLRFCGLCSQYKMSSDEWVMRDCVVWCDGGSNNLHEVEPNEFEVVRTAPNCEQHSFTLNKSLSKGRKRYDSMTRSNKRHNLNASVRWQSKTLEPGNIINPLSFWQSNKTFNQSFAMFEFFFVFLFCCCLLFTSCDAMYNP